MRHFLAIALASTFLTAAPVPVFDQPAEAKSLFEALFPRAAERRKKRRAARLQRQRDLIRAKKRAAERRKVQKRKVKRTAPKIVKVKAPTFFNYAARPMTPVKLAGLAKAFSAFEQKALATEALEAEKERRAPENQPIDDENTEAQLNEATVVLASNDVEAVVEQKPLEPVQAIDEMENGAEKAEKPVRLSSGHKLLKSIKIRARSPLGKALVAHYKNAPEFMWIDAKGGVTPKAEAVLRILADADSYGLHLEDYALPVADTAETDQEKLRAAMIFEFSLTTSALRYMADARNGLVDPNKLSGYHDFSGIGGDYQSNLEILAAAQDPVKAMLAAHPKEAAFGALKGQLAALRARADGYNSIAIAPKTFIKPGQSSDQLENIVESIRRKASTEMRATHFDVFAVNHEAGEYTPEVVALVRDFQKSVGLKADGIVGKNTIAKMTDDDPKIQLNKVLYAMERMRWHPDRFGNTHVFINQPAYRASYMKNGKPALSMRAVVGKPSNQTNFFHDKIEYVEYNPYWGIPRSILVNEMLPKLRRNPAYFDNIGYEVTNTRGKRISSSSVNWNSVGTTFPYNVRQPPGRKNALGELKIMFPNKHSIYMHDTPAKSLFQRDARAFSHGCIRLAEPRAMAAAVLGSDVDSIAARLVGGENNTQRLKRKIPVYVSYYTAWPDSDGNVRFYQDIYGRDKALGVAVEKEIAARAKARGA